MKFSFINPGPNTQLSVRERKKMFGASPPLGIFYVATILKNEGIEVSILDQAAKGLTTESTVKWVKKEDPDILGFSVLSCSSQTAPKIAEKAKKENPDLTTVFGNMHATFNAERILKRYPQVDIIVRGEGEYTTLELVECLEKGKNLKDIHGINFRKDKQIITTPTRPPIKDVDSIPFPDRELSNVEYHAMAAGINAAPKKYASFVSSRGCVYRCRFCGVRRFANNIWRPRSVENTLEELQFLVSKGYEQIYFVDDNFMINKKRVIEICQRIRKEKMDIDFICLGRVDNCSYQMLRELVKAGCRIIHFGIESANQRILNYYNKQITPKQSKDAVKTAKKAGVDVVIGSLIVGAPDETRQEIQNTLKFTHQLDLDIPEINLLSAFSGTDIWDELKMKGVLDEDQFWEIGVSVCEISPDAVPPEEIKRMIHEYIKRFFLRPRFWLAEIMQTLKSPYRLSLAINNLNRIDTIVESARDLI